MGENSCVPSITHILSCPDHLYTSHAVAEEPIVRSKSDCLMPTAHPNVSNVRLT